MNIEQLKKIKVLTHSQGEISLHDAVTNIIEDQVSPGGGDGIYGGSGTIGPAAVASVTTASNFKIAYSSNEAGLEIADNSRVSLFSPDAAVYLDVKDTGVTATTTGGILSYTSGGVFKLSDPTAAEDISFVVPSLGASYTLTLPTTNGGVDEFLKTDGSGVLSWAAATATNIYNSDGTVPTGNRTLSLDTDAHLLFRYSNGNIGYELYDDGVNSYTDLLSQNGFGGVYLDDNFAQILHSGNQIRIDASGISFSSKASYISDLSPFSGQEIPDADWVLEQTALPYKVYTAILSQTGTSNPTKTVFQNTLTGTPSITRGAVGVYDIELTGAWVSGKVWLLITNATTGATIAYTTITRTDVDFLTIFTRDNTATLADGILTDASLEIRVYP